MCNFTFPSTLSKKKSNNKRINTLTDFPIAVGYLTANLIAERFLWSRCYLDENYGCRYDRIIQDGFRMLFLCEVALTMTPI